jgi:hypothetical protein
MAELKRGWLTAKRLRVHGLLLALTLWSLYLWTIATPGLRDRNGNFKGTDFLHFYALGSLALAHRGAGLYSMAQQEAITAQRVPESAGIHYLPLYPPQVSLFFAPLAYLPYTWALAVWWFCSGAIYGICCYCVWRGCPALRSYGASTAILALAFPGFFNLIAWGQTSGIALGCFTLMFFLLKDRREFLAGLALGCLIFKPQLGVAAAIVFLGTGMWRVVAGAIVAATLELFAGVAYYGIDPLRQWLNMLGNFQAVLPLLEPRPYQTHCLRTFWSMLLPWPGLAMSLYVISAVAVLALTVAIWRNGAASDLRFPALLLSTVLVAPHLTVYDLVILAPAILLLADRAISRESKPLMRLLGPLLYLVYALPLLGPLTRWTHVQLSVVAMGYTIYLLYRLGDGNFGASAHVVS